MVIFYVLILSSSLCCNSQNDSNLTTEFIKSLPQEVKFIDTVVCFKKDPQLFAEYNHIFYGTDTILRYGPYYFGKIAAILLANVSTGKVRDYSLVFTDYSLSPRPISLVPEQELTNQSSNYTGVWGRGYSSNEEFEFILDSLKRTLGTPTFHSDSSIEWSNNGVYLKGYNSNTTLILTYGRPNQKPSRVYDWQFCAITPDSTILNLVRGIDKESLNIKMRDTIIARSSVADTVTFRYTPYTMFGLPGELSCMINRAGKIINYGWVPKSTGYPDYESVFLAISNILQKDAQRQYPKFSKFDDVTTKQFRWSNGEETIYAWYYISTQTINIGKASNEYMEGIDEAIED